MPRLSYGAPRVVITSIILCRCIVEFRLGMRFLSTTVYSPVAQLKNAAYWTVCTKNCRLDARYPRQKMVENTISVPFPALYVAIFLTVYSATLREKFANREFRHLNGEIGRPTVCTKTGPPMISRTGASWFKGAPPLHFSRRSLRPGFLSQRRNQAPVHGVTRCLGSVFELKLVENTANVAFDSVDRDVEPFS